MQIAVVKGGEPVVPFFAVPSCGIAAFAWDGDRWGAKPAFFFVEGRVCPEMPDEGVAAGARFRIYVA